MTSHTDTPMQNEPHHHQEFGRLPTHDELKQKDFSALLQPEFQEKLTHHHSGYHTFKRVADVVLAVLLIALFSPLWIVIIVMLHFDSPGKILFSHERVGQGGKKFTLWKFRTMHQNVGDQEHAPVQPNDERVTRMGHFLRRTSLDEVPQLWNVIKGDMALIGPRPEMPFLVEKYTPLFRTRLLLRPGMTGLWQVAGRKDIPLHENVEYDLYYILNESPLLDVLIAAKTVTTVINGKGAY